MSLVLFTYCLPIPLGYLFFVSISGRLDPVSRPRRLAERPSWALGLWVAFAVSSVLLIGLHSAYTTSFENTAALFAPSARTLAVLLLPSLLAWSAYRAAIARTLDVEALRGREEALGNARIDHFPVPDDEHVTEVESAPSDTVHADADRDAPADGGVAARPLAATLPAIASPEQLRLPEIPAAAFGVDAELGAVAAAIIERAEPIVLDVVSRESHEVALGAADDALGMAYLALGHEQAVRAETGKHLRITRRALARLEAESRNHENDKTDALIALEEELENRIRESSTARARATREANRRIEAETIIVALKRDMLAARRDARRSTASRSKALSAATRAVALARQAVKARACLEKRLRETEETLADRETTLSSVIRALEQEKGRTREEIGVLARQLVLHEKQLRARRSIEEVARNVEGKLTTRLARKVARARPLVPNS